MCIKIMIKIFGLFCVVAVTIIEGKRSLSCEEYIAGQPLQVCGTLSFFNIKYVGTLKTIFSIIHWINFKL